jgi:protein ImuA
MRSDLQNLAQRIAEIERNEHPCRQKGSLVGMPPWGEILLGGKLGAGALVELFAAEEGAGTWTLALFLARHACGQRQVLVIADAEKRFYPPAASRLHIDLGRTLVIRARGDFTLAAMTQSLRCPAVGAAIGKLDRLPTTDQRRLQIAAESGGGVGFLLRPAAALKMPSFATVRLFVTPVPASRPVVAPPGRARRRREVEGGGSVSRRCLRVEVVRFRGSEVGQPSADQDELVSPVRRKTEIQRHAPLLLEIDDDQGHVRLPAFVADAEPSPPAARASE